MVGLVDLVVGFSIVHRVYHKFDCRSDFREIIQSVGQVFDALYGVSIQLEVLVVRICTDHGVLQVLRVFCNVIGLRSVVAVITVAVI